MNLEIENSISKELAEKNSVSGNQPVLNIIYDTEKTLNSVSNNINTNIFTPQFDTFDMNQISLHVRISSFFLFTFKKLSIYQLIGILIF